MRKSQCRQGLTTLVVATAWLGLWSTPGLAAAARSPLTQAAARAAAPVRFDPAAASPVGAHTNPFSLAFGDFTGDGFVDLVVAEVDVDRMALLAGDGTGQFGPPQVFPVGVSPVAVAVGDVNRDHALDAVTANEGGDSVSVLLGNGAGGFAAQRTFAAGQEPFAVVVADVNDDEKPDLVVADSGGPTVSVLLGNGAGGFSPAQQWPVGPYPRSLVVVDLNHDGDRDIATADSGSSTVSVLLGDGTGQFGPTSSFPTGSSPSGITSADFTGDGNLDLATSDMDGDAVSVLLGDGTGRFDPPSDFAVGNGPFSIQSGDFNLDAKPDLVTANTFSGTFSVLVGDGAGRFATAQNFDAGRSPIGAAVGDVNNDGLPDVATTIVAALPAALPSGLRGRPAGGVRISAGPVVDVDSVSVLVNATVEVESVSPRRGPTAGGTPVTITGQGLGAVTDVRIGRQSSDGGVRVTDTRVLAVSPTTERDGAVPIRLVLPGGQVAAGQFNYVSPVLSSITPASGPTTGGTEVLIRGSGFTRAVQVKFNAEAGDILLPHGDTWLRARTPQHAVGTFTVTVVLPGLDARLAQAFTFVPVIPVTGARPGPLAAGGGLAVMVGLLLMWCASPRRSRRL